MQTFKKNQIIITALVIMIAIAGYLQFTEKDVDTKQVINLEEGIDNENITVPTALVPNSSKIDDQAANEAVDTADVAKNDAPDDKEAAPKEGENTAPDASTSTDSEAPAKETTSNNENANSVGEAVFVSTNAVEVGHFLQAKIDREQGYSSAKENYLAIIDNTNLKEEQKVDAVKKMIDLQERIEKEAAAELLLEAKGFKDVFVRILNGEVDVVINAQELSTAESAQVYDIVRRKTGVDADNIVITLLDVTNTK